MSPSPTQKKFPICIKQSKTLRLEKCEPPRFLMLPPPNINLLALDRANFTTNVVLGDHNRLVEEGTEQNHEGAKIVRPPKSGRNGRDDIAMIKLKNSIKQTAYTHAVCYDKDPASALIWPTEYGVVTGWGSRKQVDVLKC